MKNLYSAKLISRSTGFIIPLAILLILFGIASIILSAIDISNYGPTIHLPISNPNNTVNRTITEKLLHQNAFTYQSIWPTLGKGIWCGLLYLSLGIISLIVYREKTLISVRILSVLAFTTAFISVFLFLSASIAIQRSILQRDNSTETKKSTEQKEIVLNALLLVCGIFSFLVSLTLAIGTLIAGNLCQSQTEDFDNVNSFSPQESFPYSTPPYYT